MENTQTTYTTTDDETSTRYSPQIVCNDTSVISLQGAEYGSQDYTASLDNIITIGNNRYDDTNHEYTAKIRLNGEKMRELFGRDLRITHAIVELTVIDSNRTYDLSSFYAREKSMEGKILDYFSYPDGNKITVDITKQVQKLIDKEVDTEDIFFIRQYAGNDNTDCMFVAAENGDEETRPCLRISFVSTRLNADDMAYITASAGRAGKGSVNLQTGQLVWEHKDIAVRKNGVNLDVCHVYNEQMFTNGKDKISTGEETPIFRCGKSFKLNIQQFLLKSKRAHIDGSENYVYIDGHGNHHDFIEKYYYVDDVNDIHYVKLEDCDDDVYGNLTFKIKDRIFNIKHKTENVLGMHLYSYSNVLNLAINGQSAVNKYYFCADSGDFREIDINVSQTPFTFGIRRYEDGTKIRIENRLDVSTILQYHSIIKSYDNAISNLNVQIAAAEKNSAHYESNLMGVGNDDSETLKDDYRNQIINVKHMLFSYRLQMETYNKEREAAVKNLEKAIADKKREPVDFIADNDGNILGFDFYGRLVMMSDSCGNAAIIIYDNNDKLVNVVDKDGNTLLNFIYEHGLLASMIDSDGKAVSFKYDGDNLQSIEYDNGEKSSFMFNGRYLTEAVGTVSESARFLYDGSSSKHVIGIAETTSLSRIYSTGAVNGENAVLSNTGIEYLSPFETLVSNRVSGETETYIFDLTGRPITVSSKNNAGIDKVVMNYYAARKTFVGERDNINSDNLIANGKFQNDGESWGVPISADFVATRFSGARAVKIAPDATIVQTVKPSTALKKGVYMLSAWAKASPYYTVGDRRDCAFGVDVLGQREEAMSGGYKRHRLFGIAAQVMSGTTVLSTQTASFDSYNEDWQFTALPIYIDGKKRISEIIVKLFYAGNDGTAQFTDCALSLCKNFSLCEFDENGLLTSERTADGLYEYAYNNGRLTRKMFTDNSNVKFTAEYRYDGKNRLSFVKDFDGSCCEKFFDECGRIVRVDCYNIEDPALRYVEECAYDNDGNVISEVSPLANVCGDKCEKFYRNGIETEAHTLGGVAAYGYNRLADESTGISCDAFGDESANKLTYNKGYLTKMSHNGFDIDYEYDGKGRVLKTSIGGTNVVSNSYVDATQKDEYSTSTSIVYGNLETPEMRIITTADCAGKIKTIKDDSLEIPLVENIYDNNGKLTETTDGFAGITYAYSYANGEMSGMSYALHDNNVEVNTTFNSAGTVTGSSVKIGTSERSVRDSADVNPATGRRIITSQRLPNNIYVGRQFDALGRVRGRKHMEYTSRKTLMTEERNYVKRGDRTCDLVSSERFGINGNVSEHVKYMYDKAGNISEIYDNGRFMTRYAYDGANRLIREDNVAFGKTTTFVYDAGSNILVKNEYAFTLGDIKEKTPVKITPYSYKALGWRDQMTAFDGEKCDYDALGRPTVYRNKSIEWNKYGMLEAFGKTATYAYNVNGIRISKTVGDKTTKYYLDGMKILRSVIDNELDIWYNYSVDGIHGLTVTKDGEKTEYVFRKNVQGDVTHIYKLDNLSLELAAEYKYDAWGNCTVTEADGSGIGTLNPIRYRSYYFDAETGLYYLNARYYDPETGRFISADSTAYLDPSTVNGLNLFAYCASNPVMNVDPSGTIIISLIVGLAIAGAVVGAAVGGVYAYSEAKAAGYSGWELFGWTILGAVGGGIVGAAIGAFIGWSAPAIGAFMGTTFTIGSAITASGSVIAVTVTGAQIVAGIAAIGAAVGILFSQIDKHGKPYSTVGSGGSTGAYDGNGNLIYRHDTDHWHFIKNLHDRFNPHTHYYIWKKVKDVWKIVRTIVFPF